MANQPNGPPPAAVYGLNGSIMPAAGHYADMQTLMQNMESLSGWLEQNRLDWEGVQDGLAQVERLQARHASAGGLPLATANGDANEPPPGPSQIELHATLSRAHSRIASLSATVAAQQRLHSAYEDTLTDTTQRLRDYIFEQEAHVSSVQAHHDAQLQAARAETLDAQLQHQQWQGALGRLSAGVRGAYAAREEGVRPWRRKVAALREENRVLREKVGWEPLEEEWSGEESGGEEEEERGRTAAGRLGFGLSRGRQDVGGVQRQGVQLVMQQQ